MDKSPVAPAEPGLTARAVPDPVSAPKPRDRSPQTAVPTRRAAGPAIGALVAPAIFLALTVLAMWPALSDLSNTVMGAVQPGDATSGGVRLAWQLLVLPPFSGHSSYLGAPQGTPFWQFTFDTAVVWIVPQWFLAHLVGPVASWNLALALGFFLDGLCMFGLIRWLTRTTWIAIVAGALYAFSPFHVEEAYAHIGYVWTWIFPLIIWAGLLLFKRPTVSRGAIFGLSAGVAGYIDPYYLLFAPLLASLLWACALIGARVLGVPRMALVKAGGAAALSALLMVTPLGLAYGLAPAAARGFVQSRSSLRPILFQRARLWEYVVPWRDSPIWNRVTGGWVRDQLGQVQPTETSLYLGGFVILAALGYVIWALLGGAASSEAEGLTPERAIALPNSFLAPTLVVVTAVLVVFSFAYVGPVPSLPTLLWRIVPFWRVFTRLDVVIDSLVLMAASLALVALSRSRRSWWAPALAALAVVDGTAIFPWSSWSYAANTPAAYIWLARHQDGGIVAVYPMLPPVLPAYQSYVTFQEVHHHPLFDGALPGSSHSRLEHGLADINDPQTVPTLRRLGVRYVVLDRTLYDNVYRPGSIDWSRVRLGGLALILRRDGVRLYRVRPGPRSAGALTVIDGFGVEHPFLPRVERWMAGSTARLGLRRFRSGPLRVSFRARSYKKPMPRRYLWVRQSGRVVWRGWVTEAGTSVTFVTRGSAPLSLTSRPGSVHVAGFLDTRSIDVIRLSVTPVR